jgi:hypothetical protein
MKSVLTAGLTFVMVCLASSCNGPPATPPTLTPQRSKILADAFFSGCAYLDENANGRIDPEEPKLGGVLFTVTLEGGAGFGAKTPEDGCASVVIPGGLGRDWTVVARMEIPKDAPYRPIGPSEITLEYPQSQANFLFNSR